MSEELITPAANETKFLRAERLTNNFLSGVLMLQVRAPLLYGITPYIDKIHP